MGEGFERESPLPLISEVLKSAEGIEVPRTVINQLAALGVDVGSMGAIDVGNGAVSMAMTHTLSAMNRLQERLNEKTDSDTLINLGRAIGYLSNAMAKQIEQYRQVNDMRRPGGADRRRSFAPGQVVDVKSSPSVE